MLLMFTQSLIVILPLKNIDQNRFSISSLSFDFIKKLIPMDVGRKVLLNS